MLIEVCTFSKNSSQVARTGEDVTNSIPHVAKAMKEHIATFEKTLLNDKFIFSRNTF